MAHYAILDENNIVIQVFVGRDEDDLSDGVTNWEDYYSTPGRPVKRTSYNTRGGVHYTDGVPSPDQSKALRYNYAGIGFFYDEARDAFIPPEPAPVDGVTFVFNETTLVWDAAIDEAP